MLKRVKIFQHFSKGFTQLKRFLAPSQRFLFFYLAPKELVFLNKTNYSSCSKLLTYFNKKGQIIRHFFLFLVPYICFLFESLKLIRQFPRRFDQISACSNCWNILKFFKNFYSAQNFSCSTPMFLSFLPCTKRVFFLSKINSCSCSNWLKHYIKILTLKLSAALLYQGDA